MKIYLDTANVEEIREAAAMGVIDGVTTNPSLVAKEGRIFEEVIREISTIVGGPLSAEVTSDKAEGMVEEALELIKLGRNVVIKIPMCKEGLKATKILSHNHHIPVNMTLIFSLNQAILAAAAGASYVSPFVGRLDDIGHCGMDVVRDIAAVFARYNCKAEIIAASIRHPRHVSEAAMAGADIATVPFEVLKKMTDHPLTDAGIERFNRDWEAAKNR